MCSASFGRTQLGRGLIAKSQARKAALAAQNKQSAEPSAGSASTSKPTRASTSLIAGGAVQPQGSEQQPTLLGG